MDWLRYLGLSLSTTVLVSGGFGLLMAWCWPGLYNQRFLAWAYAEKIIGKQRKDRTWYCLWLITLGSTQILLHLTWALPGFMMLGMFLFCAYQLRDRLYLRDSAR